MEDYNKAGTEKRAIKNSNETTMQTVSAQHKRYGRPRVNESERRIIHAATKFNEKEYKILVEKCGNAKMRIGEYLRVAAVNATIKEAFPKEFLEHMRDIEGLCNNVNQLTKMANAKGKDIAYVQPELKVVLDDIHAYFNMIGQYLNNDSKD